MTHNNGLAASERFVREWQGPIYNYVFRMLRQEAEAADVTQEVFTQALVHLREGRVDRTAPWLYRVARNAVYRHLRNRKLRHSKESCVARPEESPEIEDPLERHELQAILEDELDQLPADDRSLLVLHYFNGLSQRDIAACLEVPRTTVASRLQRAVESLRGGLKRRGGLAVLPALPQLESLMRSHPPIPVPPSVSQSLLNLATTSAAPVAITSGLALGGTIVSKKIAIISAAVLSVLTFTAGFSVGGGLSRPSDRAESDDTTESGDRIASLLREGEELRTQNDELEEQLASMAKRREEVDQSLAAARAELLRRDTLAATPVPASSVVLGEGVDSIDWAKLGDLLDANRATLFALADAIGKGGDARSLAPEQIAAHREFLAELSKAAAKAQVAASYPILDEEFLPEIVGLYFGRTMALSDHQLRQVQDLALELRGELELSDDMTPLQAHRARVDLLTRIDAESLEIMNEEQRENWSKVRPLMDDVFQGNRRRVRFGLRRDDIQDRVLDEWSKQYRLDEAQQGRATALAERFTSESRRILEGFGQLGDDKRALSDDESDHLGDAFFALQSQFEEEILRELSPEQRRALPTRAPTYIQLEDNHNTSISDSDVGGF